MQANSALGKQGGDHARCWVRTDGFSRPGRIELTFVYFKKTAPSPMDISRVGPFAVEEKLGPDRRASVYCAVHVQQRKSVALRVFSAPLATHGSVREEYDCEFETLKLLRHPNIVRFFGGGFDNGYGYFASKLVRGESLTQMLDRRGNLPWEMVVDIALQISEGLQYAHDAGLVHARLNPDKILITEDGQVKIADFRQHPVARTALHQPEMVGYLAPEQRGRWQTVTPKTDVFSLGCLMYRMLTGRVPYPVESDETAKGEAPSNPPRPATVVLNCPVWLDTLVVKTLALEPAARPHSATAVVLALKETKRRVAAGTGVAEHVASGFSPIEVDADKEVARRLLGRKSSKAKRKPPLLDRPWFLVLSLVLLIASVLTWILWPVSEQRLLVKAEGLMREKTAVAWRRAETDYLRPLLEQFPQGEYAPRARKMLDLIEMDRAERRLRRRLQMGRAPETEGGRLLAEAMNFEKFGDRVTALNKYHGMIKLFDENSQERPYVNLARRQIAELEKDVGSTDRVDFVQQRLDEAERLADEGKAVQARELWRSIVTLYQGNRELDVFVKRAESHLEDSFQNGKNENLDSKSEGPRSEQNVTTDRPSDDRQASDRGGRGEKQP